MIHFRIGSSALGEREHVYVHLYDTRDELVAAGEAFNGNPLTDSAGLTQAWTDEDGRTLAVIVRLARGHLGAQITSHEIHHAATALYGAHVGDRISRRAHLNHYNEPFAHLFSDLYHSLIERLYRVGVYE